MDDLVRALRAGEQADMDGTLVKVSRQACEEAADAIEALQARVAKKDAEIERLRETAMPTDVLDEVERALVNAGVVLHRAQVTATMDCINASVSDPLRKNIENWRARCVMAECDAGTALDRIRAAREGK